MSDCPGGRLDPRVLHVFNQALDNDAAAAQVVLVQCFSAVFGGSEWWQRMLATEPAIAALVFSTRRRTLH